MIKSSEDKVACNVQSGIFFTEKQVKNFGKMIGDVNEGPITITIDGEVIAKFIQQSQLKG